MPDDSHRRPSCLSQCVFGSHWRASTCAAKRDGYDTCGQISCAPSNEKWGAFAREWDGLWGERLLVPALQQSCWFARCHFRPQRRIGSLSIPLNICVYNPLDLDDLFFLVIEITALLLIIWYAWRWPNTSQPSGRNASIS